MSYKGHFVRYQVEQEISDGSKRVIDRQAGPYGSYAEASEHERDISTYVGIRSCRVEFIPQPVTCESQDSSFWMAVKDGRASIEDRIS